VGIAAVEKNKMEVQGKNGKGKKMASNTPLIRSSDRAATFLCSLENDRNAHDICISLRIFEQNLKNFHSIRAILEEFRCSFITVQNLFFQSKLANKKLTILLGHSVSGSFFFS